MYSFHMCLVSCVCVCSTVFSLLTRLRAQVHMLTDGRIREINQEEVPDPEQGAD